MSKEHPPHDCEQCGKSHFSYTFHKEQADKNRKARNVLILIALISIIMIPGSITIFDLIKDPRTFSSNVELQKMVEGYDVACFADLGMQFCLIQSTENNYVKYNSEKLVLQSRIHPCLNVYLETPDVVNDRFMMNSDDVNCISSLEFPMIDGWSWNAIGTNLQNIESLYEVTKTKQWWDNSNCPEVVSEDGSKKRDFCNWWLKL